ncbi:hypothetical protein AYO21_05585 [Fonsecaea monophora]|uniref:Biogenesis of lysosome-related organelles complex 1 subunit KXD1 n=3 Tax=Fonsecaea TaxID=40354 RepID=A0A0D2GIR6_9EURO|nr:uncharacterized protein Z517_07314 [Fonsecaea pedrosoi CBS 271.37]XP_022501474.1 hypothetical protein AYO20_04358 [Fonsecaea nubica]XP_022512059.1 hypothetical protein AYO21_05585 [Fonsecaea monophora]KIW80698.1 hypothetical protein Z517_07314 [Fonsecaea pedrosoi CBS 271.37]OAG40107.1 hypothetical protein AYO21_05585 [Fonsecaea monophora]OAL36462.1 hypothetical protein AYO20_04358 [Fonsecaea nubica]
MATTAYSRHPTSYATHQKTLPITMPSGKAPVYSYPQSRVLDSPELPDTSTSYTGSRTSAGSYSARSSYAPSHSSGDCDSYAHSGVDVVDMLSDKMNAAFDPIRMDRSLAKQAQTSGELNAKQRELQELQAMAQRRLKSARVNFAEGVEAVKEARRDVEYTSKKISAMKSKAEKKHPEAYAKASRSRHA